MLGIVTILCIDADAHRVKDEVHRVAACFGLPVIVVANGWIRTPASALITAVAVGEGPDVA